MLLVGTDRLLVDVESGATILEGSSVTWLAVRDGVVWALLDARRVVRLEGTAARDVGSLPDADAQSLGVLPDGSVVAGRTGARLARLRLGGRDWEPIESFERVEGRDDWQNPANPTPDSRSMAVDASGMLWVNVHVGGVWRSKDAGTSWTCAIEPDADVHEVRAGGGDRLAVAAAVGFGWSEDGGATWRWSDRGLHGRYARAVALDGDLALVSASTGPGSRRAAVYRARLGDGFERCAGGMPEWFDANVDTGHVDASAGRAGVGGPDGSVYVSEDAGETWEVAMRPAGVITALRFV